MKRTLVLLAIVALAACRTGAKPEQATNPYAGHHDAVLAGGKLFRSHCAGCHGALASGGDAPSLRTTRVQLKSEEALFRFLTNGNLRHGMPSWSRLPDERRWQIVTFLKSLTPST
jgi:mono/diheme cytochrome c family protein